MKRLKSFVLFLTLLVSTLSYAQTLSQTFSWHGLTMRYPSDYTIMDKEADSDGYTFNCVGDDEEVISILTVSFYTDALLMQMTNEGGVLTICQEGIEGAVDAFMDEDCTNLRKGNVAVDTSKSYPYVYQPFTVTMSGIPITGKVAVSAQGDMMVIVAMLTDEPSHLSTLQAITNSIKKQW